MEIKQYIPEQPNGSKKKLKEKFKKSFLRQIEMRTQHTRTCEIQQKLF